MNWNAFDGEPLDSKGEYKAPEEESKAPGGGLNFAEMLAMLSGSGGQQQDAGDKDDWAKVYSRDINPADGAMRVVDFALPKTWAEALMKAGLVKLCGHCSDYHPTKLLLGFDPVEPDEGLPKPYVGGEGETQE